MQAQQPAEVMFTADEVLARVDQSGDLMAGLLTEHQCI